MDQSSFAAPHGFSQRITSFIACACQGIHQMPLRHLIVLIANAHHQASKGGKPGYLLQPSRHDAIDVFDRPALSELRRAAHLQSILRPASRDQIRGCAVRQHPPERRPDEDKALEQSSILQGIGSSADPDQSSLHNVDRTGTQPTGRCKPLFSFKTRIMVEPSGIEPPTSAVRLRRSPS